VASSPRLRVVQVADSLEAAALTWLRSHDEREYSFVDATSFAVMRSWASTEPSPSTGDFTSAGLVELR
jgi:predicted nucleic acid-binding protein